MPVAGYSFQNTLAGLRNSGGRSVTFCMVLMAAGLSACTEASERVDAIAREGAKSAVTETIATRFPAVPKQMITPFTDCVIDNASSDEVRVFAKSAVIGVDDTTVATVRSVLSRPETVRCLSQSSLGLTGTLG
ncbi:hypothetical protein SAMN04488040_2576 [Sulfitobacter marinus]|uniref:Succinate dehydrogenase n=1 Tax=Sulfitobacter marinus TaxID=394264 RepID=A0A1I6U934_9RHOB|nr:hypothetical protein [Sulfitobacter marinus]SFS97924.1 hypothetical protein SAMN04488040_2576 [Sulfitobacter marinus]